MSDSFLQIENLTIEYRNQKNWVPAVRDVHLSVKKGETIGLVGESGCGKSTLALSLMGLLSSTESRISGKIILDGENYLSINEREWQKRRGKKVAMIFQDPFSSLNPVLTIDSQIQECLSLGNGSINPETKRKLLDQVQLTDTERILSSYPHQLSGGQRQRVMIAMALARQPELLIADEPTTALDVTVQDEIVKLLKQLQSELRMTMVFVTHNMGLAKDFCDKLAVMYAGQIVEEGKADTVLKNPQHPYTQELLKCIPSLKRPKGPIPVLEGHPPAPYDLPRGCAFHPRCKKVLPVCSKQDPSPVTVSPNKNDYSTSVRCHLYHEPTN